MEKNLWNRRKTGSTTQGNRGTKCRKNSFFLECFSGKIHFFQRVYFCNTSSKKNPKNQKKSGIWEGEKSPRGAPGTPRVKSSSRPARIPWARRGSRDLFIIFNFISLYLTFPGAFPHSGLGLFAAGFVG